MNSILSIAVIIGLVLFIFTQTPMIQAFSDVQEDWKVFSRVQDQSTSFIACDASFARSSKFSGQSDLLILTIRFENPTPEGMPGESDWPKINDLDDQLSQLVSENKGFYSGRVTFNGARKFYIYFDSSSNEILEKINAAVMKADLTLESHWMKDNDKATFYSEIYPNKDEWRMIKDMSVLRQLESYGDIPEIEREILHWSYFTTKKSQSDFTNWIEQRGYILKSASETEKGAYSVNFSKVSKATIEKVNEQTSEIENISEELGGEYDGWETSIEKGENR